MLALSWKQHYDTQLIEAQLKSNWEQTRLLAAYSIAPYSKQKIKDLKQFIPFDWDEGAGPKIGSPEYIEQMKEIRRRILEKEKQANGWH